MKPLACRKRLKALHAKSIAIVPQIRITLRNRKTAQAARCLILPGWRLSRNVYSTVTDLARLRG